MNQFPHNPAYVEYETLLTKLHRFIAAGMGDSDEAEAVREEMDAPWLKLSSQENMRLNGLSADLYALQNNEIYEPYTGTREQLRADLNAAWGRGGYETTLALLRKGTPFLTPDRAAYLRGRSYAGLGHPDVGLLFLRDAAGRDPERAAYRVAVLDLLLSLHRTEDALAETHEYVRSADRDLAVAA